MRNYRVEYVWFFGLPPWCVVQGVGYRLVCTRHRTERAAQKDCARLKAKYGD